MSSNVNFDSDGGASPIFLSYAKPDWEIAKEIAEWFEDALNVGCFVAQTSIPFGEPWREAVLGAIDKCIVGVVLVTSHSAHRDWVQFEIGALCAKGKPIVAVHVLEHGVEKVFIDTLEKFQFCEWSTETNAMTAARIIRDALRDKGVIVDFKAPRKKPPYIERVHRRASDKDYLDLLSRLSLSVNTAPYEKHIAWDSHDFAPVFRDTILPTFRSAVANAAGEERRVSLASDLRLHVAERIIRTAQNSLLAITMVEDDQWLFSGASDNDYVQINVETAQRLTSSVGKGSCRRLVVFPARRGRQKLNWATLIKGESAVKGSEADQKKVADCLLVLRQLSRAGVDLKWLDEDALKGINVTAMHDAETRNVLLIDDRRMTVSTGTSHIGSYTTNQHEIEKVKARFRTLWSAAWSFNWTQNGAAYND